MFKITLALDWERRRLARNEREARAKRRKSESPTRSVAPEGAHSGRDARAPSEELE